MSATFSGWSKRPDQIGVLIDRCIDHRLGLEMRRIPGLRAASLAEMYGDEAAQHMADVEFLAEAGHHGWQVWTQNPAMWRVDAERNAIINNGTQVFCIANPQLTTLGKGFVFGRHILSIRRRSQRPTPCFWRLYHMESKKDLA